MSEFSLIGDDAVHSRIDMERFTEMLNDTRLVGQILFMEKSCIIWVNVCAEIAALGPLVVAMPSKFDSSAVSFVLVVCEHSPILVVKL